MFKVKWVTLPQNVHNTMASFLKSWVFCSFIFIYNSLPSASLVNQLYINGRSAYQSEIKWIKLGNCLLESIWKQCGVNQCWNKFRCFLLVLCHWMHHFLFPKLDWFIAILNQQQRPWLLKCKWPTNVGNIFNLISNNTSSN